MGILYEKKPIHNIYNTVSATTTIYINYQYQYSEIIDTTCTWYQYQYQAVLEVTQSHTHTQTRAAQQQDIEQHLASHSRAGDSSWLLSSQNTLQNETHS